MRYRIGAAVALLALVLLGAWLFRDDLHGLLADWTGEEDTMMQLKGLGYIALGALQPAPQTADFAPMPYADVNPFGVNTFLEQEVEESKVRRSLEMIRAAGFHWIRQEFPWEDIEQPAKGQFWDTKYNHSTWDKYDRIVDLAHEYGLEIVARLDLPPAWTRADGRARGNFAPPDNNDDYGDYVAAVVSRYRGKVRFYQLWNEPNIYPEWGNQPVNARDYVRLLKVGYTRAKAADPNVVILSAGLAPTTERGPDNVSDLIFLQQMYDAGVRGYFDILAVQDYGLWTGPGDRRLDPERTNFSRPQLIREIMVKNGDAAKPIWAMEVGWNTAPPTMEAPFGRVTQAQQAHNAVQAYERAQAEWPWMGVMMTWFFKPADEHEKDQPKYYFRLLDPDFTPHPVYEALRDYIAQARVMQPGFHAVDHWAVDSQGDWETRPDDHAYFGSYQLGQVGDALRFTFEGTDLELVPLQNPYGGAVRVQVDNGAPQDVELWRTDPGVGGRISLASDLDDGAHHVSITVTRAPAALNGFIVRRSSDWLVRRIGLVLGAVALFAGAWRLWARAR